MAPVSLEQEQNLSAGTNVRPAIPPQIKEFFLPANLSPENSCAMNGITPPETHSKGMLQYHPALLGQSRLRLIQHKYNLDTEVINTVLIENLQHRGVIHWDEYLIAPVQEHDLQNDPFVSQLFAYRFAALSAPLNDSNSINKLRQEFTDWSFRAKPIKIWANEVLKLYGGMEDSQADIRRLSAETARKNRDEEIQDSYTLFEKKINQYQEKLIRAEHELETKNNLLEKCQQEEPITHFENVLILFSGRRRRIATSMTKNRMTQQAKSDREEEQANIEGLRNQSETLTLARGRARQIIHEKWADIANQVREIPVPIYKKDLMIEFFGVAWIPYYVFASGTNKIEIPAWGKEAGIR